MDRLFRQRMQYLTDPKSEQCFLCAAGDSDSEKDSLVLAKAAHCFAMMNKYPYNTGHLMVAPFQHIGELENLADQVVNEMMQLVKTCITALKEKMSPHGFNLGANLGAAGGAGVPGHVHLHVVPRWGGDTNFMPVVAGTKVLPETIAETYNRLKPGFS